MTGTVPGTVAGVAAPATGSVGLGTTAPVGAGVPAAGSVTPVVTAVAVVAGASSPPPMRVLKKKSDASTSTTTMPILTRGSSLIFSLIDKSPPSTSSFDGRTLSGGGSLHLPAGSASQQPVAGFVPGRHSMKRLWRHISVVGMLW